MEKYARGCTFIKTVSSISHKNLSLSLIKSVRSSNQTGWESMKTLIKMVQHEDISDWERLSVENRRKYLTFCKWEAEEMTINDDYLHAKALTDRQGFEDTIRGQGKRADLA